MDMGAACTTSNPGISAIFIFNTSNNEGNSLTSSEQSDIDIRS